MSFPLLRRSPTLRSLALLVQVAAVLCQLAEGAGRLHCPHHDLVPSQAMAGMDHEMGPGMEHGAAPVHHKGAAGHACTCLGECCLSAGALPSSPMPALVIAVTRSAPARFSLQLAPRHLEARQPPSTGPPASA
jgi:uncharacterized protein involved in copper resistance